jgi:adenylate cyclase
LHAATGLQNCDLLETQSSAEKLTRRAVGLNEADAEARSSLAFALLMRSDHYGALAEAERALALSQTRIRTIRCGGSVCCTRQRRFISLSITRPRLKRRKQRFGHIPIIQGRTVGLLLPLARPGRAEEAKKALARAIAVSPTSFSSYVRNRLPWLRSEDHDHMLHGLRKAGCEG